jgi:hypothetical protein
MQVKVIRGFRYKGETHSPGKVIDLPDLVVREVIATGKAEAVVATPPPSGPMTTESVPAIVAGKKQKGLANVRF